MGSYLTFSPLFRERNVYFLLHYCPLSETFPLRSTMPCVARTFLSPSRDSDRTACLYILDLMILDFRFQPHKANALTPPLTPSVQRGAGGIVLSFSILHFQLFKSSTESSPVSCQTSASRPLVHVYPNSPDCNSSSPPRIY